MSDDRFSEVMEELRHIRREGQQNGVHIATLLNMAEEREKEIVDHENRIRVLEKWQYALPITGVTALGSIVISAWSKFGGAS